MNTLPAIHPALMDSSAAAAGLSAFRCDTCGGHITKENESGSAIHHEIPLVECDTCGGDEQGSITVIPDSVQFIQEDAVKDVIWYHATYVEDWFRKVSTGQDMQEEKGDFLYLHVGSEQAARDIARDKYFSVFGGDLEPVFLYQVRLKADAVLSSRIVNDDETWSDFSSVTDETVEALGGDAVRYLNRWEAPGSISLLVDARQLEFVAVSPLDSPYKVEQKELAYA